MIPFTLDTLDFYENTDNHPPFFRRAEANIVLRDFNAKLLAAEALTVSARALIHGAYGSTDPNATTLPANPYDETWYPPGTGAAGWAEDPQFYRDVVARYCRPCHLQVSPEFGSRDDFRAFADLIEEDICWHRSMPHSAAINTAFWNSTPSAPALLDAGMAGAPGWRGLGCPAP
jgi:hypothetical protein